MADEAEIYEGRFVETEMYVLQNKVQDAINAMDWLEPADEGVVQLALEYARRIDKALKDADDRPDYAQLQVNATKALYLGPHLINALKTLGGAPEDRANLRKKLKELEGGDPNEVTPAGGKVDTNPVHSFMQDKLSDLKGRL